MIRRAQKDLPIIMEKSLLVGDKETDILAGKKAGLRTCLITGGGAEVMCDIHPDFTAPDILTAARFFLRKKTRRG
jgi:histidinol phosphatase-like enzyme